MVTLRGEPAGADLLLKEEFRGERFNGLLAWLEGDVGEVREVFASLMESGDVRVTPTSGISRAQRDGETDTDRKVRCASPDERRVENLRPRIGFQHSCTEVCIVRSCHALTVMTCIEKGPCMLLAWEPRISIKTHLNRVLMGHKGDRDTGGTDAKSPNERGRNTRCCCGYEL